MDKAIRPLLRAALTLLFLGSLAAPARADWFLTPYFGAAFGGASNQFVLNDLADEFEQRVNFGGSLGWRSKGIFGFEVDYSVRRTSLNCGRHEQFRSVRLRFERADLDGQRGRRDPGRRLERDGIPAVRDRRPRHDSDAVAQRELGIAGRTPVLEAWHTLAEGLCPSCARCR